ncbi:cobalt/nickel transport system permease protein [Rhodobacter aestuarii]|uniref:Cobalt/nickel transport system permease protein n=1 Tax=Rhodobacter aestuarii TaxID=453582 RepID=A0A1N7L008_9RHOB|nr:cobalt transporter CbiM [Rhodobacter aestuarii]PTV95472.1 cobalt/nickel transport system permease protein [Rhodobacter aestuarii]SIS67168.1 cobalt/nickel transport system permease protein [Rhodobacter aestuarii]
MAHIPDGLLTLPVLIGTGALAAGGVALGLRALDDRAIPRVALLAAVFFAASLVAVPVGPSSVHLMLSGLMGVMLGWGIFPAVLVALALQAALFGLGGLTTLGTNTLNIALPGALVGMVLGPMIRSATSPARAGALAALGAVLAVAGTAAGVALALFLSAPEFTPAVKVLGLTYLPLALVEAGVSGAIVTFLARVEPHALHPNLHSVEDQPA